MTINLISSAQLPNQFGVFNIHIFVDDAGIEHPVLTMGALSGAVLTRIHSACATGDIFGSLRCDCQAQLNLAMAKIGAEGSGIVDTEPELEAVRGLIGQPPYERPLLIEYLHQIQDAEGCLPAGHLQGLAELMRLPMAEVYEVATFYAHFDVVGDGEERPAAVTIRVCDSLSCMLAGAEALIGALGEDCPDNVRVVRAPCIHGDSLTPETEPPRRRQQRDESFGDRDTPVEGRRLGRGMR